MRESTARATARATLVAANRLMVTHHATFEPAYVVHHARLIDTRNATRDVRAHRERIVRA